MATESELLEKIRELREENADLQNACAKDKEHSIATEAELLDQIRELRGVERSLREENETLQGVCGQSEAGQIVLRYKNEAALMREISEAIVSELDLDTVLNLVADKARAIVRAESVLIPMITQKRDRYVYEGAAGENAEEILGTSHRIHVGMCGWALTHEKPLLFGQPDEWWADSKTRWEDGMASALLVPLFGKQGTIIGGLSAMGRQGGGSFNERDLELFTLFANQVSIAIENARLFRELSDLAANLEQRVRDRTGELANANAEISELNKRLRSENLRMSAELDVSRRLQQMVLPRDEELAAIHSLDISGQMQSADEVGGDYYDVLQKGDAVHVGIGDVTGHGLESGVIMLMVQTAVRALLESGLKDEKAFLSALNRTIYKNAQRMSSDKNLTLTMLRFQQGKLHMSGQHEEVLIIRNGGKIERIDTINLGFMVGLVPNIDKLVAHTEIDLRPGDSVILYTDGVTEARNHEGSMYGVDRLCQVLSANWDKPAVTMKQAVLQDLKEHVGTQEILDDITLLVMKPASIPKAA